MAKFLKLTTPYKASAPVGATASYSVRLIQGLS